MPTIAAAATPIAYGDFRYYRIQDRTGFSIQRLNELYAGSGQVGFRGYHRVDGRLLLPEAVKTLKMAAA
jgi:HK97 family phage major capsid protein